jgi:hypothetical protein
LRLADAEGAAVEAGGVRLRVMRPNMTCRATDSSASLDSVRVCSASAHPNDTHTLLSSVVESNPLRTWSRTLLSSCETNRLYMSVRRWCALSLFALKAGRFLQNASQPP